MQGDRDAENTAAGPIETHWVRDREGFYRARIRWTPRSELSDVPRLPRQSTMVIPTGERSITRAATSEDYLVALARIEGESYR